MVLFAAHILLALLLFRLANWIGEHATDFGYTSTTLFEEPNEALALNFFIRALAPSVFMVTISAAAVATGYPDLRFGIYWIAIYYYGMRALYIVAMNMHRLVSWSRFVLHAGFGLFAAFVVYKHLILPNRSLLPNLDTAGNELWLAIFAFLYAAANKVKVSTGTGDRRRNAFIKRNYDKAEKLYGSIIDERTAEDTIKLIIYSVIIYESYCRPPFVRTLERLLFWKKGRTTGIMQVASQTALTDGESVELGTEKLCAYWLIHSNEQLYVRTQSTILDYNKDINYLIKVLDVMEILAKRAQPRFYLAYKAILGD